MRGPSSPVPSIQAQHLLGDSCRWNLLWLVDSPPIKPSDAPEPPSGGAPTPFRSRPKCFPDFPATPPKYLLLLLRGLPSHEGSSLLTFVCCPSSCLLSTGLNPTHHPRLCLLLQSFPGHWDAFSESLTQVRPTQPIAAHVSLTPLRSEVSRDRNGMRFREVK